MWTAILLLTILSLLNVVQAREDLCPWSDWSSCSATCGGGRKTRVRTGTDCPRTTEDAAGCNNQPCRPACVDTPNWQSKTKNTCAQYQSFRLCTSDGGYGSGWKAEYGTFAEYADANGLDATEACCGCGREVILCRNITCQNGGLCYSGQCSCPGGYGGDRCQYDTCELTSMDLEQSLQPWHSPEDGSGCGFDVAQAVLADYGCVVQEGCPILKCRLTVPSILFGLLQTSPCPLSSASPLVSQFTEVTTQPIFDTSAP